MTQELKYKSNRTPSTSSQNQNNINGFLALKKLKQTQEQIDMMKRRVSILKAKQQENQKKIAKNKHRFDYHNFIQQKIQEDKAKIKYVEMQKKNQIQRLKEVAKNIRIQQKQKIKNVREEEYLKKKQMNKIQRQQHFKNEDLVHKKRQRQFSEKKQSTMRLYQIQKSQKQKINFYKQSRIRATYDSKNLESNKLIKQTNSKQRQLYQLAELQMRLSDKYSQSIQYSQRLKQNPQTYSKLPSIRSHQSHDNIVNKSEKLFNS